MKEIIINKLKKHKEKLFSGFVISSAAMILTTAEAHADIFSTAEKAVGEIEKGLLGISTALAACCGVVGLIAILVSGERGAAKWVGFLKRVAIAYGAIWAITGILELIKRIGSGG